MAIPVRFEKKRVVFPGDMMDAADPDWVLPEEPGEGWGDDGPPHAPIIRMEKTDASAFYVQALNSRLLAQITDAAAPVSRDGVINVRHEQTKWEVVRYGLTGADNFDPTTEEGKKIEFKRKQIRGVWEVNESFLGAMGQDLLEFLSEQILLLCKPSEEDVEKS